MQVQNEKKVIRGTHADLEFTLDGGILEFYGQRWDKDKVKILLDLCNLLKVDGYDLIQTMPTVVRRSGVQYWPSVQDIRKSFGGEEDDK